MKDISYRCIGSIMLLISLMGCQSSARKDEVVYGPPEYQALHAMNQGDAKAESLLKGDLSQIRYQAIRDTALSIGARTALAYRGEQINQVLAAQETHLDQVFNFKGLMLEGNIIPPVLLESRNDLSVSDPQNLRVADRTYRILKQASFATVPPEWREYLVMDETRPEAPDPSLLPKNADEQAVWSQAIDEGWDQGYIQADQIYADNLARLKRDYQGMVRYRMLLAQNMVSAPQVAQRDLGVTGGGDKLAVNDRILTIKALPSLKPNSEVWKPNVSD